MPACPVGDHVFLACKSCLRHILPGPPLPPDRDGFRRKHSFGSSMRLGLGALGRCIWPLSVQNTGGSGPLSGGLPRPPSGFDKRAPDRVTKIEAHRARLPLLLGRHAHDRLVPPERWRSK